VTPRYSIRVDRIGTADYAASVFRGARMIADIRAHRRDIAVSDAVESVRYLRRGDWLDAAPARIAGGAL
jgi:hypothetical protein